MDIDVCGLGLEWRFAFDHDFKLYRTGEFYDVKKDPLEKSPLQVAGLTGESAAAAAKLQGALKPFDHARPEELDRLALTQGKKAR